MTSPESPSERPEQLDLVIRDAELLVTMSGEEIAGGWVGIADGVVREVGGSERVPPARDTLDARGCLVTPGLINTHHHMFQNLSRAYAPASGLSMDAWFEVHRGIWAAIGEESAYLSAWVAMAELLLGGCTLTTDDLFLHPRPRLVDATVVAARELGIRFHPVRDGLDLPIDANGIVPAQLAEDVDDIAADASRLIAAHHDPSPHAMVKIGVSACGLWGCSPRLFERAAQLAGEHDLALHTHFHESPTEEGHVLATLGRRPVEVLEEAGWGQERSLLAHAVFLADADIERIGSWRAGVAHCPSSNAMICEGITPVRELRAAGACVGLGCDGSASADHCSMWLEARTALLLGKLRDGPAGMSTRDVLEMATVQAAACLGWGGQAGILAPGSCGDAVAWRIDDIRLSGACSDPVETWLRCGPLAAHHTVVAGVPLVRDGRLLDERAEDIALRHGAISMELQGNRSGRAHRIA